jgi:hypothetical protein
VHVSASGVPVPVSREGQTLAFPTAAGTTYLISSP